MFQYCGAKRTDDCLTSVIVTVRFQSFWQLRVYWKETWIVKEAFWIRLSWSDDKAHPRNDKTKTNHNHTTEEKKKYMWIINRCSHANTFSFLRSSTITQKSIVFHKHIRNRNAYIQQTENNKSQSNSHNLSIFTYSHDSNSQTPNQICNHRYST